MSLIGRIRTSWTRIGTVMLATGAVAGCGALSGPAPAAASSNQMAMFEDDGALAANPVELAKTLRALGVSSVRVDVAWYRVAPQTESRSRPNLNMTDPNNYNWAGSQAGNYDLMLNTLRQYGIGVDLLVGGGAPLWATQPNPPVPGQFGSYDHEWFPSAAEYGQFVQAVAKRYPWVRVWELWDEPNWGPALSPQYYGSSSYPYSARLFRSLLNAAWGALRLTGHNHNTIIAGSMSQDGSAHVGQTGTTAPLTFMRTLYCVDSRYRQLRGNAAASVGCPTTKAASKKFRGNNPALFTATGVGVHPYPYAQPPNRAQFPDPNGVEFNEIPNLITMLDRANKVYGSKKQMLAYNTEYGYQIGYVNATNAANYINWAEYLSFKNPRIASYDQFELKDGAGAGAFNTGLISSNNALKPSFFAYRLPVWLPGTTTRRGRALEVWGGVRPANFARIFSGKAQFVSIQFASGGSGNFRTIKSVKITNGRGYFDVNVKFPSSGQVRLAWTYPNVPALANPVDPSSLGRTVYSRVTNIALR
jgi:hypothetical protein